MRISGNMAVGMSNMNANRINQSVHRGNNLNIGGNNSPRRDRTSISPMGKAASLVESLMKQKQNIADRKNEMISNTLEKGGSMESISAELESYDEQLKELDKQLFEATKPKEDQPENEGARSEPQEDEIQKALKEKGFQTVNASLSSALIKSSSAIELSKAAEGIKVQTEGNLKIAKMYNRPNHEIAKLEDAVARSTQAMMSAASDANKAMSDAVEQSVDNSKAPDSVPEKAAEPTLHKAEQAEEPVAKSTEYAATQTDKEPLEKVETPKE